MKKYYEAYDLRYRQVHERGLEWFGREPTEAVKCAMEHWGVGKDAEMLEIGCGEGRDAAALLEGGYHLLATDVSPQAVAFCREKFPQWQAHFQVLDCLQEKLAQRFDFIYSVAVLHMLVKDEDRRGFWQFMGEHLAQGGVGLVVVMGDGVMRRETDPQQAFDLQQRLHQASGQVFPIASTSCRVVTREELRAEIADSGLVLIEEGDTAWDDTPWAMYAVVKRGEPNATGL